jgi:hypothetical protein
MACDVVRQRVVLFSGWTHSGILSDTWEWDGSNWTQRSPATSPSARQWHAMAHDSARQRVVLFGGSDQPNYSSSDTWEWDGGNWTQRSSATAPAARRGPAMAYDMARQRVMLFGGGVPGRRLSDTFSDTWLFGRLTPAISQPFGKACPGTSGPPVLTSNDPYLGSPAFRLVLASARESSICLFGLSPGTQTLPIGPCTLYLSDPILLLPEPSNAAGFAQTVPIPLPIDIALRGAIVYAQTFVVDPQVPVFDLAFSAGLGLVLGD